MRERFKKLPAPLRVLILGRFAAGLAGLAFIPIVLASGSGLAACVPCVAVMALGGAGGLSLLADALEGRYVVLEGFCDRVEKGKTGRDIRAVWLRKERMAVKVISRGKRVKGLSAGDRLSVYISEKEPVYDMGQYKVAGSCLAIERKEGQRDERRGAVRDVG